MTIAILVVLMGLLIPSMGMAREYARQGACMSNQRQAGIGFANYALNHNQHIPGPNTSSYHMRQGHFRIWSIGPDGIDQDGQHDDIVYESPRIDG